MEIVPILVIVDVQVAEEGGVMVTVCPYRRRRVYRRTRGGGSKGRRRGLPGAVPGIHAR